MTIDIVGGAAIGIFVSAWLTRRLETRIQHLEHEVAQLHAGSPAGSIISQAGFAMPSTPEVERRYNDLANAMPSKPYTQADHTAALAESMRKDRAS